LLPRPTLAALAAAITNPYQATPMDGATLQATVTRYNAGVDAGTDADFGKPTLQCKIQTPPFYAAWATPLVHDTRAVLRINETCQVMDMQGQVIPACIVAANRLADSIGMGRAAAQLRGTSPAPTPPPSTPRHE
jgi:FAD binding domain